MPDRPPLAGAPLTAARLSGFYGAYFLVSGVMFPFWPLFLGGRGLDAAEIGLILGLSIVIRTPFGPFIGRYADRSGMTRGPLIACALAALAFMAVFFWAHGFWPLLWASLAFSLAYGSVLPFGETLALRSVPADTGYGRVRVWGSIAFAAAAAVGGAILEGDSAPSPSLIVWLVLATVVLLAVASLALPEIPAPAGLGRASVRAVLADRQFVLVMLATSAVLGSHVVYYGFSSLHWAAQGISTVVIGLLWAIGVVAEIVLFAFGAGLIRRLGLAWLFGLAAITGAVRWAVLASTDAIWLLALAQCLHAFSFGAMHLGAMLFITRNVPGASANTAQALYATLPHGLALGGGLLAAGWLYELWGSDAYWPCVALSALGGIAVLFLARDMRATRAA